MTPQPLSHKKISFRFATQEDAAAISELARLTFYEAFASFNTESDMLLYSSHAFAQLQLEKEIHEEGSWFLLAFDDDVLIGYARLKINGHEALQDKRTIKIERFYIRATHTGRHVGSLLMQECLNHSAGLSYQAVWLGVWEHNHRALAFYKKWGFAQFGSHPFILGSDVQTDLLMKKELP